MHQTPGFHILEEGVRTLLNRGRHGFEQEQQSTAWKSALSRHICVLYLLNHHIKGGYLTLEVSISG